MWPVTFDQPLYIKASEIAAAKEELNKVIVRLGGFHLMMSYMGSIGYIMTGSGLSDLWERVYAKGSVVHMLTGHAFTRAVRAHIFTFSALICILLQTPGCMDKLDKENLKQIYQDTLSHSAGATDIADDSSV